MSATLIGTIVVIVVAVIAVAWIIYLVYQHMKDKTLDEIRGEVYDLFLMAEKSFKSDEGQQKLQWVVSKARALLPGWLSALLSEKALTGIIQAWFNTIKDLLDDGKLNGSAKENEETEETEVAETESE